MVTSKVLFLIALLGLAGAAAAESAFLLARRDLSTLQIKTGVPLTITVEVHNAGDAEATNVKVSDAEWDTQLFETKGDISATFDSIAPGATKAFSFSVTPAVTLNRFEQPHMTIFYDTNGRSISTTGPVEHIKVHSKDELLRQKLLFAGAWLSLGTIRDEETWVKAIVGVAGAAVVYILYGMARGGVASIQSAKRKRALKEFGVKDE